jgi:hypothetical protein
MIAEQKAIEARKEEMERMERMQLEELERLAMYKPERISKPPMSFSLSKDIKDPKVSYLDGDKQENSL